MKRWYESKTVWALAVSAIAHCLVLLGMAEGAAEAQAAELVTVIAPIIGLIADAFGAWGRRRADGPLA